jgi:glycerol uptake facilitator-like aquaporin
MKDSVALWGSVLISAIVTFGFFAMLYLVIKNDIPAGSRDLANIMLGSLGTSFTAVVGYWVGSSIGSARKDAALRAGEKS